MAACDLVSVIVPCFNQGRFLPDAIDSLLKQTYRNWECIVVNDGSFDETEQIALEFCERDRRIRYVAQANRGLAQTRNRGLDQARGPFIQFLDADDVILPGKLELQVQAMAQSDTPAIAYCQYQFGEYEDIYKRPESTAPLSSWIDPERAIQQVALDWETRLSVPIHCYLFDARLFNVPKIRFDGDLPNHEDWDCVMRLLSLQPRLLYIDKPLAIYRLNTASMCRNLPAMRVGFLRAIRKQKRLFRHNPEMKRLLTQKLLATKRFYREHSMVGRAKTQVRGFAYLSKGMLRALVLAVRAPRRS